MLLTAHPALDNERSEIKASRSPHKIGQTLLKLLDDFPGSQPERGFQGQVEAISARIFGQPGPVLGVVLKGGGEGDIASLGDRGDRGDRGDTAP